MADSGFGVSITFSSTFFAEILSVNPPSLSRAPIETTHSSTTNGRATFIPSDIIDNGEIEVEMGFIPGTEPPIGSAAETITITYPTPAGGMTGATAAFSGFLTSFTPTVPIDDRMTARATIKVSGAITYTAAT